jgi:hypothetical protein
LFNCCFKEKGKRDEERGSGIKIPKTIQGEGKLRMKLTRFEDLDCLAPLDNFYLIKALRQKK